MAAQFVVAMITVLTHYCRIVWCVAGKKLSVAGKRLTASENIILDTAATTKDDRGAPTQKTEALYIFHIFNWKP